MSAYCPTCASARVICDCCAEPPDIGAHTDCGEGDDPPSYWACPECCPAVPVGALVSTPIDVAGWREVTTHHDGHGLNDTTRVYADRAEAGGAPDRYVIVAHDGTQTVIQFQRGPRHEPTSRPGILHEPLLAVVLDRCDGFQRGPYACEENLEAVVKIAEAIAWHRRRADERAARGVLGRLQP